MEAKRYTAIIVEDERLPCLSLIQKLETFHPDVEVIDSCSDCETALKSIYQQKPDILFLDIQLPGQNSLWLLDQLKEVMPLPYIIFTTAYNEPEFLIKAIRFSVIDYLLKPINIVDLGKALQKIREGSSRKSVSEKAETHYMFRTLHGFLYIKQQDIVCVKAEGNYSLLILTQGQETIFERLGDIEAKLSGSSFLRAGRSVIINKHYLYKVDRKRNKCTLKTSEGQTFTLDLSAGGMEKLNEILTNPS